MTEEGYDILEVPFPAVFTVVKEINEPRFPSLKGKMRAKKAEIEVYSADDLGLDDASIGLNGSPTRVVKIFTPPTREKGTMLEGDINESAAKLADLIKDVLIG